MTSLFFIGFFRHGTGSICYIYIYIYIYIIYVIYIIYIHKLLPDTTPIMLERISFLATMFAVRAL